MADTINNKRIIRNTFYLYVRMGVVMLVQLYTSRVVLQVLGVDDFGLWSVIASFIVSFSFVQGPLTTATQRFLSYEMGSGGNREGRIFSTSLLLFLTLGAALFVILETVGVWFLNTHMNIPDGKQASANWVFQFSILAFITSFVRMPYDSALIAYERMSFYTIICVVEVVLLLGIAYILLWHTGADKIVMYGVLLFASKLIVTLCCKFYCNRKIACTHFHFVCDGILMRQIGSFSGWNLFGALSIATATQGINILLNMFFNVTVNAAYAIANQMAMGLMSLVSNFQKAVNPQIIKSYATKEMAGCHKLICMASKYSFFLLFALVCPAILNMEFLLRLWLGDSFSSYTPVFCQLMLCYMLLVCISLPMETGVFATGKIRGYQIVLGFSILGNIIISYFLFLKANFLPVAALYVKNIVEIIVLLIRLLYARKLLGFSVLNYFRFTMIPICAVLCATFIASYVAYRYMIWQEGWQKLLFTCMAFYPIYGMSIYLIGMGKQERIVCKKWLTGRLSH